MSSLPKGSNILHALREHMRGRNFSDEESSELSDSNESPRKSLVSAKQVLSTGLTVDFVNSVTTTLETLNSQVKRLESLVSATQICSDTSTEKSLDSSPDKDIMHDIHEPRGLPARNSESAPSTLPVSALLAQNWSPNMNPTGYWISEKLDGVRAFYYQGALYNRNGRRLPAPVGFFHPWASNLPENVILDGELFMGRGKVQSVLTTIRSTSPQRWQQLTYHVFDAPHLVQEMFEMRKEHLYSLLAPWAKARNCYIRLVPQVECSGEAHLYQCLEKVHVNGGEGIMLRKPHSLYEEGRSMTLLKVKTFHDAEAKVIKHRRGTGERAALTSSIEVMMECGKTFYIGAGFSNSQHRKPPKPGSIITYRFHELTNSGIPRYPVFVGEAPDKTCAKDAVVRTANEDTLG
ncbi:hypothetical protein FRC17_001535 [Serendipita sp. 399]|nr:hypothetical protein FRC17_001535 [Serendipita sp. 399]